MKMALSLVLTALLTFPVAAAPLVELSPEARRDASAGDFKELKQIEAILKDVSSLRQLPVKRPIQISTLARADLAADLKQRMDKEIPPDKLRGEQLLYQQLGMLPTGFDYAGFMLDLYAEQIGGYYDPETQALRLIKGNPLSGLEQQMLIAHELTHALQDQHYDLQKYLNGNSDNDDRTLAHMALIEGDATVAATEYIQRRQQERPMGGLLDLVGTLFSAARMVSQSETFRSAPRFIQDSLLFPYQQGAQFVTAFRDQGWSWQEMGKLYQRPPTATEQIFHPQLYVDAQEPGSMNTSLLKLLPGAKNLSSSVWGELGYRQALRHHLGVQKALSAARGWHADRYEVLDTPEGPVVGLFSTWDSAAEAEEFEQAWQATWDKRYPDLQRTGTLAQLPDGRALWLERQGEQVLIVEGLTPTRAKAIQAKLSDLF
ncbi:MAG: hypothetical protein ACO1RX_13650 [Candidatus Sericytochromatia bacterium]